MNSNFSFALPLLKMLLCFFKLRLGHKYDELSEAINFEQIKTQLQGYIYNGLLKKNIELTPFTPLMLLAATDIANNLFMAEIAKAQEYVTQSFCLENLYAHSAEEANSLPSFLPKMNALTIAAASGSLLTFTKLHRLNYFVEQDYQVASMYATLMEQTEIIKYLLTLKSDLWPIPFYRNFNNCFDFAYFHGKPNVLKILIDAGHEPQSLIYRKTYIGLGELDEPKVMECNKLFMMHTETGRVKAALHAITENDLFVLDSALFGENKFNLIYGMRSDCIVTLLSEAAVFHFEHHDDRCYQLVKEYLKNQSAEMQIQVLLLAIQYYPLSYETKFDRPLNINLDPFYQEMIHWLKELDEKYHEVRTLYSAAYIIIPTWQMDIITQIIKYNKLEEIKLLAPDASFFASSGYGYDHACEITALLLNNTSIIRCDVSTISNNKLIVSLLELIIERNNALSKVTKTSYKDKIYNTYVDRTNSLINDIKSSEEIIINSKCLENIKPKPFSSLKISTLSTIAAGLKTAEYESSDNLLTELKQYNIQGLENARDKVSVYSFNDTALFFTSKNEDNKDIIISELPEDLVDDIIFFAK